MAEEKLNTDSNQLEEPAVDRRVSLRGWLLLSALLSGLLLCDLLTKHWAQVSLQHRARGRVTLIEGWLDLTYVRNPAGAWGFMRGMNPNTRHYVLLSVSLLAVGILVVLLVRSRPKQTFLRVALACILAGALGNIIDRVRWRYVVDFIDWHKWFRWPTFNVADIAITVGVIMMAVEIFLDRSDRPASADEEAGADSDPSAQTSGDP
jgi:signal peptidase II